jgi:hypothetical protein
MEMKETQEFAKALEVIAIGGVKIFKEKDNMKKLEAALEVIKQYEVVLEGIKGAEHVIDEVKDIDQAEATALGFLVWESFKKVKEALK